MLHTFHEITVRSRWDQNVSKQVAVNLFLFDPREARHEKLERLESKYPEMQAIYKRSRLVLLRTYDSSEGFSFSMVEIGPRGLSAASSSSILRKDYWSLPTEARFLTQTHERQEAFDLLGDFQNMTSVLRFGDNFINAMAEEEGFAKLKADGQDLVQRFEQNLDADILRIMADTPKIRHQAMYNWLALSKERRMQAVLDYPRLAPLFMSLDRESNYELSSLLDLGGGSLEEFLCEQLRVRKATLQYVCRMPDQLFEELEMASQLGRLKHGFSKGWLDRLQPYADPPLSLILILDALPLHLFPQDKDDWEMLGKIAKDTARLMAKLHRSATPGFVQTQSYLTGVEETWTRYMSAKKTSSHVIYNEEFSHAEHAVSSLVEMLIIPTLAATGMVKKNRYPSVKGNRNYAALSGDVMKLFTVNGMKEVFQFSRQWHERGVSDRLATGAVDKSKDELLLPLAIEEPWTSPQGYRFEPLRYYRDIHREAREMKHCLASMAESFLKGHLLGFKVFGPDDFRATATLKTLNGGKCAFHGIEFYEDGWLYDEETKRKKRVKAPVEVALQLVNHLNETKAEVRTCEETERFRRMSGNWLYNIQDAPDLAQEIADANFEVFLPLLPKRLRARTAMELIEGPFLQAVEPYVKKSWIKQIDQKTLTDEVPLAA